MYHYLSSNNRFYHICHMIISETRRICPYHFTRYPITEPTSRMKKTSAVRICCTSVLAGSTAARDAASWLTLPMNMSVTFRPLRMESSPARSDVERRWVSVGVEKDERIWALEYDRSMYYARGTRNLAPSDAGCVVLADTVQERRETLEDMGTRFYRGAGEYSELACINAWLTRLACEAMRKRLIFRFPL